MTPPPAKSPAAPRRFKKRYAAGLLLALGSVGTMLDVVEIRFQLSPTPGVCFVIPTEPSRRATASLPRCDESTADTNALDGSGEEVWCQPPMGWVRTDGGVL